MTIFQTDNRICVKLTIQDMVELDITYEELDYSNIETRRVLWTLLDEARHKLGREICLSQKMIVEAVPDNDGGCTIFFTVNENKNTKQSKKQLIKLAGSKIICGSVNIDNMINLAKVISSNGKISKSELFTDGTSYRMIIRQDSSVTENIESIICEFCDIYDAGTAASTYEHWKILASPDALGLLCSLYD